VEKVHTPKVEILYWTAILFSNTLGTALGDFLADDSGLGFAGGAMLIGGLLAVVVPLTFFTNISRVLLFWIAFVLTKGHEKGGLGYGTIGSSAVLGGVLLILVLVELWRHNNVPTEPEVIAEEL